MRKFIFTILLLTLVYAINSDEFTAATANWQPYAIEDANKLVTGIGVDILKEVCKRTGDKVVIKIYPAERLNQMFDLNQIDINFADSPNWNEIKKDSPFVFTESYTSVVENIYFLANKYIDVKTPNDLKQKRVGIVRGYYYEMFKESFKNKIVLLEETNNESFLIQMLKKDRLDCAFFDNYVFDYLLVKNNFKMSDFKKGLQLSDSPLCFKVRIEKKDIVTRFNKALLEMKKEGVITKIILKYTNK
ncbi:MAG: hypothetical protein A2Y34_06785 [Spirochaetes bacterium GWC1_27_15]|nr:MAG: hypothetical protein A2Z98_10110 [Spirochaetes bacterium GWB1_27_13]OHD20585.1 MAG: hypothetical protein A2Y34_06785 [Spirochaetes bacterium GWC1_27_15]